MRKETAWFVGGAALAAATAAGASVWSQYGSLVRWQEPELPIRPTTRRRHTYTYKIVNDRPLQFDLYLPPGEGPFPVVVYAHGGAFVRGSRSMVTLFHPLLDHFLGKGIAVVSIDYRLFEDGVYFPDNIIDVSDALSYLKQHESLLTLDTSQLLVWGDSAGAALMLATALDRHKQFVGELGDDLPTIKGVIALYPPTNFLLFKFIQTWLAHLKFYEGSREEWRELMVKCSPVSHLYADAPPILLLHGKKDPIVPFGQALHFVEHASDVGANVQLISFPNGTHSLASFLQSDNPIKEEQLMARINRFIDECLV